MTTETISQPSTELSAKPNRLAAVSKIISSSYGWAAAAGAIPLPLLDMVALAAVQASMVNRIAGQYGESISDEAAKSLVAVLLGTIVPSGLASMAVGSGAKLIPGVGYVAGSVALGGFGAAATYAIGKIFVRHFEGGGTISNFSPAAVQNDLKKEFTAAKAGKS